jgi:hypothetical protein
MADIMPALISMGFAVVGGIISSGTNYLIEWRKSRNEEIKLDREKKIKELERRHEIYIKFLSTQEEDIEGHDDDGEFYFNSDILDELSASIITYGSPKVSSLVARSFPLQNWETIEAVKRLITSELVLEKGGRLSLTAGTEYKELDAYMGKKI